MDTSGACCSSNFVDECGVCDGDGTTCALTLTLVFAGGEANETRVSLAENSVIAGFSVSELHHFVDAITLAISELLHLDRNQVHAGRVEGIDIMSKTNTASVVGTGYSAVSRMLLQAIESLATGEFQLELVIVPNESHPLLTLDAYENLGKFIGARIPLVATEPQSIVVPVLLDLRDVARQGICQNRICEVGEQLTYQAGAIGESACVEDCPFPLLLCPSPSSEGIGVQDEPCGLNGVCSIASGTCSCFAG